MLGSLRFLLALLVAFSHMGLTPDFHFGSMAVMGFYLIAGYVMTYSFKANFEGRLANIGSFYIDRAFRIYPLYLLSLLMIYLLVRATGYGVLYLDGKSMFVNLTMFGLNVHPTIINPATWSLGTEVQFYLLLPFLVRFKWLKYSLLPLSYAVFVAASLGHLDAVLWGYKYLPGTLFFFILGSILHDVSGKPAERRVLGPLSVSPAYTCHYCRSPTRTLPRRTRSRRLRALRLDRSHWSFWAGQNHRKETWTTCWAACPILSS